MGTDIKKIKLGKSNLEVSRMGLGLMGMSEFYGDKNDDTSIAVILKAIDLGINFMDTADMYGTGHNEELLGRAVKGMRDKVVIATKFGNVRGPNDEFLGVSNKPDYILKAVDASLKRLGTDYIDLYYMHRKDPDVPIEDTVGTMADLVKSGKVKYIGLSEVIGDTIRKAYAIHPIAALQSEYSLWSTDIERTALQVCEELDISLVAYSPVGRGFLTGKIKSLDKLSDNDYRRSNPRFQGDNLDNNLAIVEEVERIASEKNITAAQVALAWLLHKGDRIIPIPGTKREKYLIENWEATNVNLTSVEMVKLDSLSKLVSGTRYAEASMKFTDQ